jgi:hypothetical protein
MSTDELGDQYDAALRSELKEILFPPSNYSGGSSMPYLLVIFSIARICPDVDPKYHENRKAAGLLNTHPELKDALDEAWGVEKARKKNDHL